MYRKTKLFPSTKASALDGSNNIYSENSFIPILSSAAMNPWWLWRPRTGTSRLLPVMLTSPGLRQIFTRCTLLNQTKFTLVYLDSRASSPLVESRAKSLFVLIFSSAERVKVLPMRARLMWNIANFTASWNLNMRSFKMDNHCSGHKKMKCSRSDSLRLHLVSILRHSHKYLVKQVPVLAFKDFGTTPHIHIVPTFNWISLSTKLVYFHFLYTLSRLCLHA